MKDIVKGLAVLNGLALIGTSALVWLMGRNSVVEMLDIASYVGLGMGALGALMFVGSTSGSSASTGMAASAADQPSRMMDALWGDKASGISTGALFVLGGITWLCMAWLLAMVLDSPN
ncbi:hypothetical protein FHR70_004111 [Microvirga lupini]|uniref:Uncharacterized protein n=1 Tax=Microvirga lupini TaxID=420324 RepID=A0A7W4YYC8_9HYPH|nr:hypothetical protein [Microvirga lupini]MBB3021021.1 hypothetical protein [Microvirga lupini]